jgi:hypothetical protein
MTPAQHPGTGPYTWPVPDPADTTRALAGISGDITRGLPPKTGEALIFLAAVHAAGAAPDADRPIPYTLTPKALAALDAGTTPTPLDCGCGSEDCPACAGWACVRCGDAFFGTAPDDGLCPPCRAPRALPGRTRP